MTSYSKSDPTKKPDNKHDAIAKDRNLFLSNLPSAEFSDTATTEILSNQVLENIIKNAISSKLVNSERRPLLFALIPPDFWLSLPVFSNPLDQIRSDLSELNKIKILDGIEYPPLITWLKNAVNLAHPRPEAVFFQSVVKSILID